MFIIIKHGINYVTYAVNLATPESTLKRILKIKIKELSKDLESIKDDFTMIEATGSLANSEIAFIVENNYKGYLRIEDFFNLDSPQKKVVDIQYKKEKMTIDSNKSISEALKIMLNKHTKSLCITEKESIIGMVNLEDILQTLRLSKQNLGFIPSSRNNLDKRIIKIKKGKSVGDGIELMKEKNVKILLVYEEEKIIGIFTLHEFINAYKQYSAKIFDQNIETLMLSNFPKIDPDIDILEAKEILLEKDMNYIPVIIHDEILGILNIEKISEALLSFFGE